MANKANSLAHTKWMCKYHIVFTPKYRRKIIVTVQTPCLLQDDLSVSGKSCSQCLVGADTVLSACTDI